MILICHFTIVLLLKRHNLGQIYDLDIHALILLLLLFAVTKQSENKNIVANPGGSRSTVVAHWTVGQQVMIDPAPRHDSY